MKNIYLEKNQRHFTILVMTELEGNTNNHLPYQADARLPQATRAVGAVPEAGAEAGNASTKLVGRGDHQTRP